MPDYDTCVECGILVDVNPKSTDVENNGLRLYGAAICGSCYDEGEFVEPEGPWENFR